ncbi:MAG: AI-2E family transporter, partial [Pseudolabrys sp.]
MKQDRAVRILLLLCTSVVILAALYFARAIIAPVAFSLFVIAIAWPLQRTLQAKVPKLLALVGTIVITLAVIAVLVFLVVWGFGRVVQWVINNTDR